MSAVSFHLAADIGSQCLIPARVVRELWFVVISVHQAEDLPVCMYRVFYPARLRFNVHSLGLAHSFPTVAGTSPRAREGSTKA
jgi:hypothetical protein